MFQNNLNFDDSLLDRDISKTFSNKVLEGNSSINVVFTQNIFSNIWSWRVTLRINISDLINLYCFCVYESRENETN